MAEIFDLLGDPIMEAETKRGRPPHVPTDEKRRTIIQLLAFGWTVEKIAAALAITPPTLRKNYFRELKTKTEARFRVEAKLISALMSEAEAGNVAAIDKYFKRLDKHDLDDLAERVKTRGQPEAEPTRGKKQQQKEAAGKVGGKFAPPPAPKLFN